MHSHYSIPQGASTVSQHSLYWYLVFDFLQLQNWSNLQIMGETNRPGCSFSLHYLPEPKFGSHSRRHSPSFQVPANVLWDHHSSMCREDWEADLGFTAAGAGPVVPNWGMQPPFFLTSPLAFKDCIQYFMFQFLLLQFSAFPPLVARLVAIESSHFLIHLHSLYYALIVGHFILLIRLRCVRVMLLVWPRISLDMSTQAP